MRNSLLLASFAAVMTLSLPAFAYQESEVSIAYADGYMGTDHQFHNWEHRADAQEFRAHHADMYRAWRHDDRHHHEGQ